MNNNKTSKKTKNSKNNNKHNKAALMGGSDAVAISAQAWLWRKIDWSYPALCAAEMARCASIGTRHGPDSSGIMRAFDGLGDGA